MGINLDQIHDRKLRRRIIEAMQTKSTERFPGPHNVANGIPKPLLNVTERRYADKLMSEIGGIGGIMMQAITLRLAHPFKSYRPDLAYLDSLGKLVLVEVKAPHRFMEKGIAKAALAAKTYPMFRFELAMWKNKAWKLSIL